jgi:hypothetical protein
MIRTFADCPERVEDLKSRDWVLNSYDWKQGLCPNTCPISLRNSDYSRCYNQNSKSGEDIPACRLGGLTVDDKGWCEAIVASKRCPRGFVR